MTKPTDKPEQFYKIEEIEEAIIEISKGMQRLKSSRLTDRAIRLLIFHASKAKMSEIIKILKILPDLEKIYLKPKPKSKTK